MTLQRSSAIRQNQRTNDKLARQAKQYDDYDWNGLATSYKKLNQLYIDEQVKYLRHHNLLLIGKKKDKIMRIMVHFNEDNIVEQCDEEETNYEDEDDDNAGESDDGGDDEVVTLVETVNEEAFDDVPVSGTCTRSARQSIPSSRYLSSYWLS